jgi:chromosome segregation ATPase
MAIDRTKALTYKKYLAKAASKMAGRDFAREKLEEQIVQLRKLSGDDVKKHLDELERRIADAIEREKQLLGHKAEEDSFHRKLRDRMEALEKQIHGYLSSREQRLSRVAELEQKIADRLKDKSQQLVLLKDEVARLERLAAEVENDKGAAKKLEKMRQRIDDVKKAINQKEKDI